MLPRVGRLLSRLCRGRAFVDYSGLGVPGERALVQSVLKIQGSVFLIDRFLGLLVYCLTETSSF